MSTEPGGALSAEPGPTAESDRLDPAVDEEGIWRLATALSGAVEPEDVAVALAEEGASAAGASFANMAMLESETNRVRVVHGSGLNPGIATRWAELHIDDPTPCAKRCGPDRRCCSPR